MRDASTDPAAITPSTVGTSTPACSSSTPPAGGSSPDPRRELASPAVPSDLAGLAAREAQGPVAQGVVSDPPRFTSKPGTGKCIRCGAEAGDLKPPGRVVELRWAGWLQSLHGPAEQGWLCFYCFSAK